MSKKNDATVEAISQTRRHLRQTIEEALVKTLEEQNKYETRLTRIEDKLDKLLELMRPASPEQNTENVLNELLRLTPKPLIPRKPFE